MSVNIYNLIFVLVLILVFILIDVFFYFYNQKYINNLLNNEFKGEKVIYQSRLALFAYVLPLFLLIYLLFVIFSKSMFSQLGFFLQLFLIFVTLCSCLIVKSIFVVMTNRRIIKFSTLKLMFVQSFNIEYKSISQVRKNDFLYDSSIYIIDINNNEQRLDGEVDAGKIYSLLVENIDGGFNE